MSDYIEVPYRMKMVEDKVEGGFVVSYPDLPGCTTSGKTIVSAIENAIDAKRAWIDPTLEVLNRRFYRTGNRTLN
ncbi:hypothetical protein BN3662_00053 [Clostridiales bacterium CHKCI006]|nr:hypothetical protein BN3662_00053 [Clostridiales bacterium CHKCI006]